MRPNRRSGVLTAALILGACIVPEHGEAALSDRFPADAYGAISDPEISALAAGIVGRPFTISCTPDPGDGTIGRTYFHGSASGSSDVTYQPPDSSEVNGDLCGSLDKLLHFSPAYFKHDEMRVAPILKPGMTLTARRTARSLAETTYVDDRTFQAGAALLTLAHEATHAELAPAPFTDDGDDSNGVPAPFDEGLVECTAIRNVWNTINSMRLPAWFKRNLYAAAQQAHLAAADDELTVC